MTDVERYRQLAVRLVKFMDDRNYVLEDSHEGESRVALAGIPQGLLRDFRKAVHAEDDETTN